MKKSSSIIKKGYQFIDEKINWYPGHMKKATTQIEDQISRINVFLEICDARAPISTHNSSLAKIIPRKVKKILILNKTDLAHRDATERFLEYYKSKNYTVIGLNAKGEGGGQYLLKEIRKIACPHFRSIGAWMMIAGIPNVGKSTIINGLRKASKTIGGKSKSAKVGPNPGVTRGLSGIRVSTNPLLYLIDTPGIMPMNIESNEVGYKLLLCNCIRDGLIDNIYLCDYLLHCFNEKEMKEYTKLYNMNKTEYIYEVINAIHNKFKHKNVNTATDHMLKDLKEGKLGIITFDVIPKI